MLGAPAHPDAKVAGCIGRPGVAGGLCRTGAATPVTACPRLSPRHHDVDDPDPRAAPAARRSEPGRDAGRRCPVQAWTPYERSVTTGWDSVRTWKKNGTVSETARAIHTGPCDVAPTRGPPTVGRAPEKSLRHLEGQETPRQGQVVNVPGGSRASSRSPRIGQAAHRRGRLTRNGDRDGPRRRRAAPKRAARSPRR